VVIGEFLVVSEAAGGDCANATDASNAVPATPAMAYLAIMMVSLISETQRRENTSSQELFQVSAMEQRMGTPCRMRHSVIIHRTIRG
jgi:hypothetical protein